MLAVTEDVRIADADSDAHRARVRAEVERQRARREAEQIIAADQPAPTAVRLFDDVQILAVPEPPMLVAGRLVCDSSAAMIGPPGVGKSLLALSLAVSVASGLPWLGAAVACPGPVLWVLAEGGAARFGRRIRAAKTHAGLSHATPIGIHTFPRAVALLDPRDVTALAAVAASIRPALVVIDTYSRCAVGGDENSTQDTSRIVSALDQIRDASGSLVLPLHHLPKDGRLEPRGSTALAGAVDTIATLSRVGQDRIRLACSKQRDAAPFAPLLLQLRAVEDSVVPVVADAPPDEPPAPGPEGLEVRILAALPASGSRIASALREDRTLVFVSLRRLESIGVVRQTGSGRASKWVRA